jgi:hypothetical protein
MKDWMLIICLKRKMMGAGTGSRRKLSTTIGISEN